MQSFTLGITNLTLTAPDHCHVECFKFHKFQQDSAPSHAATRVQDWMDQNLIDFWPKQFWPLKSPDLNPMDYSIWSALEKAVNVRAHPNLVSLKKSKVPKVKLCTAQCKGGGTGIFRAVTTILPTTRNKTFPLLRHYLFRAT